MLLSVLLKAREPEEPPAGGDGRVELLATVCAPKLSKGLPAAPYLNLVLRPKLQALLYGICDYMGITKFLIKITYR